MRAKGVTKAGRLRARPNLQRIVGFFYDLPFYFQDIFVLSGYDVREICYRHVLTDTNPPIPPTDASVVTSMGNVTPKQDEVKVRSTTPVWFLTKDKSIAVVSLFGVSKHDFKVLVTMSHILEQLRQPKADSKTPAIHR